MGVRLCFDVGVYRCVGVYVCVCVYYVLPMLTKTAMVPVSSPSLMSHRPPMHPMKTTSDDPDSEEREGELAINPKAVEAEGSQYSLPGPYPSRFSKSCPLGRF